MTGHFYTWRIYHPNNWKPKIVSGASYTEPPVNENHEYLIDAQNSEGEFDGYLITTLTDEMPTISEYWALRGWQIEQRGRWNKVDVSPTLEELEIVELIEVHNPWTIYGINEDGSEAEQPTASPSRPQDWGDARWHYERFKLEWETSGKRYINHAHCWTDIQLTQPRTYPHLFASLIVTILMPGQKAELCGRDYLGEEDFWDEEWGPMPPVYHDPDENYDFYE